MKKIFRPSVIVGLGILIGLLAVLQWWPRSNAPARPLTLPVEEDDLEIAWLNPATSAASWERFVTAASQVTGITPGPEAFPAETTVTPQLFIPLSGGRGRLVVRWYKLTSDSKSRDWIEAFLARERPPIAIIGGSNSDAGTRQAQVLAELAPSVPEQHQPLLFLTTATADAVASRDRDQAKPDLRLNDEPDVPLIGLYKGRTFRFCFTNRQMGEAVVRYVWSQPELQPDVAPVYLVTWEDDGYSRDLIGGFWQSLAPRMTKPGALPVASTWAQFGGLAATGGSPLQGLITPLSDFRFESDPQVQRISWSVGSYDRPNRLESDASNYLLDELDSQPYQMRPLLVLGGQSQPSRRFLRSLCRSAPIRSRSFVIVSGDGIGFNTIYRDRNVAWPIQDLPCSLVFFCHHNPIDRAAGFGPSDTSTEEVLLYANIINALRLTAHTPDTDAQTLRNRLRELRRHRGKLEMGDRGELLFEEDGDRRPGSGEHVVWLRPIFRGERVLPESIITVSEWQPHKQRWHPVAEPLKVQYNQPPAGP